VRKEKTVTKDKKVKQARKEQLVRFRLTGRAVPIPGTRMQDNEDNVSSLSGVRLCNQEL
jgi:hypothetical protein